MRENRTYGLMREGRPSGLLSTLPISSDNPGYDRVALVRQIEKTFQGKVEFVSPESNDVKFVLAVQGCSSACADLSAFQGLEIRTIISIKDAERFVKETKFNY